MKDEGGEGDWGMERLGIQRSECEGVRGGRNWRREWDPIEKERVDYWDRKGWAGSKEK